MYNCLQQQQQQQQQSQKHQQDQDGGSHGYSSSSLQYGGAYCGYNAAGRGSSADTSPRQQSALSSADQQQRQQQMLHNQFYNSYADQQLTAAGDCLQSLSPPVSVPAAGGKLPPVVSAAAAAAGAGWPNGYQVQTPLAAAASGFHGPIRPSMPPALQLSPGDHWPLGATQSYYGASDDRGNLMDDHSPTSIATDYSRYVMATTRGSVGVGGDFHQQSTCSLPLQQQTRASGGSGGGGVGGYPRRGSTVSGGTIHGGSHHSDHHQGTGTGGGLERVHGGARITTSHSHDNHGGQQGGFGSTGGPGHNSHVQVPFDWMRKQSYPIIPNSGNNHTPSYLTQVNDNACIIIIIYNNNHLSIIHIDL